MAVGRRTYFSVGAMVLAGAVLLVGFILFLTGDRLRSGDVMFETYSRESVQGLETGSPVRYRGVQVGRVTEIGLASAQYRRPQGEAFAGAFQLVVIRFAVDLTRIGDIPRIDLAVAQGLRARLASTGITGVVYIELDFADPERYPPAALPWEPRDLVIPSQPSTAAQVQSAAEQLLRRVEDVPIEAILTNLNGLVSDLRARISAEEVQGLVDAGTALLNELRQEVRRADLPAVTEELRGAAAGVRGLAEGREVRQALVRLNAALGDIRTATRQVGPTVGRVNSTVGDVQAELAPLLRDLRAITSNLRETSEALRRSPSQTLLGAPPPAPERPR
ncbi:MlaD family protein [Roseococcus sp. DSY-14]|uniref:MlaD family protein n=1 Tax=Roseococcus sp. DSY-14 TaxID=3369650 RepID=UPI00387B2FF1